MVISVSRPASPGSGSWRGWQHRQGTNGEKDGVGGEGEEEERIGPLQVGQRSLSLLCTVDGS